MKTNLQFSPMLLCLCQAVKTEHWRSLEFWWEQMISLWLALWVQSREFNYMVRGASCGDQLAEDLAPDPTPHHNSNPRFVGTSVGDAPLVPLHLHHSSPAPKDIGFGPKVNNSLTHLNSENIWRTNCFENVAKFSILLYLPTTITHRTLALEIIHKSHEIAKRTDLLHAIWKIKLDLVFHKNYNS